MPKVSEAHIEARRQQILEAANACFSRQGFHQSSVQDICREAGLSPGAVYRYFPSKEHIIAATCSGCQQGIIDLIDAAKFVTRLSGGFPGYHPRFDVPADLFCEVKPDLLIQFPFNAASEQKGSQANHEICQHDYALRI